MRREVWRRPFNIQASCLSLVYSFVPCTFKCSPLELKRSLLMLEWKIILHAYCLAKTVYNYVHLIDFAVDSLV